MIVLLNGRRRVGSNLLGNRMGNNYCQDNRQEWEGIAYLEAEAFHPASPLNFKL
jgi:hypothetical protein